MAVYDDGDMQLQLGWMERAHSTRDTTTQLESGVCVCILAGRLAGRGRRLDATHTSRSR